MARVRSLRSQMGAFFFTQFILLSALYPPLQTQASLSLQDPSTQSNYLQIATQNLTLDWSVDFGAHVIEGSALHHLLVKEDGVNEVIFDTNGLSISKVEVDQIPGTFSLKAKDPVMGSALHIPLRSGLKSGAFVDVKVTYKTAKDAIALQWLEKEQTLGKKYPYLYSQSQPIYARSMAPLQDSPSAKFAYSAKVTSVYPVLMSALRVSPPSDGRLHDGKVIGKDPVTYFYNQPLNIPTYILAIASGNVVYRPFPQVKDETWSAGVWTEPEMLDSAYNEFNQDIPKFIVQAERETARQYKWGTFDMLVLPPSYPNGGMENICLSFLPTAFIAGDRSLVEAVVPEVVHSWFGNGITPTDARHLWLNVGWTTYMERLLQQVMHTPAHRDFSYIIGENSLNASLKQFKDTPRYQRMVIDLKKGEDPNVAYSNIPSEKGSNFLLYLERTLGGLEVFLPYVQDYVNTFRGQNITTELWKDHIYSYFNKNGGADKTKALDSVNWNAWFFGEGTLVVKLEFNATLVNQAYDLAKEWQDSRSTPISQLKFSDSDLDGFDFSQKAAFLDKLLTYPQLPSDHFKYLDGLYKLSTSTNTETQLRYYLLALLDPTSNLAKASVQQALNWVVGNDGTGIVKGRVKYCEPIFKSANAVDKNRTVGIYNKTKMLFHPTARNLIAQDLGLA